MLLQYDKIKEGFIEYMRIAEALNHYGQPLVKQKTAMSEKEAQEMENMPKLDIFGIARSAYKNGDNKNHRFNIFCDYMKESMWRIVFESLSDIARFDLEK